ncbi:hypothetical protein CRUP_001405, partial [Coryphaenoides rupestris]
MLSVPSDAPPTNPVLGTAGPPGEGWRRGAWKKRWFILRSGRLTGDPDVLEYYKNDHAKKPIRVIDLNLCEQVDAGLTFNKKDLEHSFIF